MPTARFAPSPTGELHIGHAFAALFAREIAGPDGILQLRIEDIDTARCREEYVAGIERDLAWLGLRWPLPVRRQSEHFSDYRNALARLAADDLTYPCFCTRKLLGSVPYIDLGAPHGATPLYPGTCRLLSCAERTERMAEGEVFAIRLDVQRAIKLTGSLAWRDLDRGWILADPASQGDVVLARKDTPASYHLAVTLDDAAQEVDVVTRADDLFAATHIHRLLQAILDLPVPVWRHHTLLTGQDGRRYAKRERAPTLRSLREAGRSAAEIRNLLGFP